MTVLCTHNEWSVEASIAGVDVGSVLKGVEDVLYLFVPAPGDELSVELVNV